MFNFFCLIKIFFTTWNLNDVTTYPGNVDRDCWIIYLDSDDRSVRGLDLTLAVSCQKARTSILTRAEAPSSGKNQQRLRDIYGNPRTLPPSIAIRQKSHKNLLSRNSRRVSCTSFVYLIVSFQNLWFETVARFSIDCQALRTLRYPRGQLSDSHSTYYSITYLCDWSFERSNERNLKKIKIFLTGFLQTGKTLNFIERKSYIFFQGVNYPLVLFSENTAKHVKVCNIFVISIFLFFEL